LPESRVQPLRNVGDHQPRPGIIFGIVQQVRQPMAVITDLAGFICHFAPFPFGPFLTVHSTSASSMMRDSDVIGGISDFPTFSAILTTAGLIVTALVGRARRGLRIAFAMPDSMHCMGTKIHPEFI
jgi:hypothetical protein